jgi:3-oxoacyl-[acyl-carrier-protein] synthase-3
MMSSPSPSLFTKRAATLKGVRLLGSGAAVPETCLKNEDLAQLVDTSDEWIRTRTGIEERRVLAGDETLAGLATEAAQQALENAQVAPEAVDFIIAATSTPDERYPAMAARIQHGLGAVNAAGFDLALACTGFVSAVITAEQFIRTGLCKTVLVVGADAHSKILDWTDRNTCVLFGDGAGAWVLQASEHDHFLASQNKLNGSKAGELAAANTLGHCPLVPAPSVPANPYVHMNGREVFKFAVGVVPKSIQAVLAQANLGMDQLDWLVLHQANARIMQAMSEKLDLPLERMVMNLQRYGNTSAASIPLAYHEAVEAGQIQPGQTVAICGFGGGLSWSTALFKA